MFAIIVSRQIHMATYGFILRIALKLGMKFRNSNNICYLKIEYSNIQTNRWQKRVTYKNAGKEGGSSNQS